MNSSPLSKFAFFVSFILAACTTQAPQISTATILPPSPTPDSGIITPENVDQLVQIKQIGMGTALGSPEYSPDGKWLYQATTTGVFVFDTSSYVNNRLLDPYSINNPSESDIMNLSPDGKLVAIGNDLVVTENGSKLPNLEFPTGITKWPSIDEVKFSPDGSIIARVYDDAKTGVPSFVGLWRISDGKILNTYDIKSTGYSFGFSIDGRFISIKTGDRSESKISLYEILSGKEVNNWASERSVFLPDNTLAIESDGVVRIFDLATGKVSHAFYGEFAAFSPDNQLIVLLNFGQFKIYRISDEQQLVTLEGDFTQIADNAILKFSPDGQTLAGETADICCGSHTDYFFLWNVVNGKLIKKIGEPDASSFFNFSPNSKLLAMTDRIGKTQILNASDGSLFASAGAYNALVSGVAFLPNGQQLVVAAAVDTGSNSTSFPGDYQQPLFFYEVNSGNLYKTQPATIHGAEIGYSTDGKTYSPDELLNLPSIREGHTVGSIAFSSARKKVAIGYTNGVFLWDLFTKTLLTHKSNYPGQITSLDFSPDGKKLAVAYVAGIQDDEYSDVQIWDLSTNAYIIKRLNSGRGVSVVTFSPDGHFLAAGGQGGVVVWNVSDGSSLFSINEGILGYVFYGTFGAQRMAFSPDGRILAIGLLDSTVELWDTGTRQKIYSVKVIDSTHSPVYDLDFSPDGKLLAAGFEDGAVRIYSIK